MIERISSDSYRMNQIVRAGMSVAFAERLAELNDQEGVDMHLRTYHDTYRLVLLNYGKEELVEILDGIVEDLLESRLPKKGGLN
ncbi:hypothetical protein HYT24_02010 [Candidatus Pacearchaeota archaeon]|nr:hypothetical protein [Candidatus Pacearchaeota archaeon]